MRSTIVSTIREQQKLSQADLARLLGVSLRTITNWEGADIELPIPIAHQLRTSYQEDYLNEILGEITEAGFEAIPSEVVNVWLVDRFQCVMFSGGNRLAKAIESTAECHTFHSKERREVPTPTMLIPMQQDGLTTYPLKTAIPLIEDGEGIKAHPKKRYKGTDVANHLSCGRCLSLLYIPIFEPSAWGPIPVFLLCFQNKLTSKWTLPIKEPPKYNDDDLGAGGKVADKYKRDVVDLLRDLDMFKPNSRM
jgi:transcriptional regulator with XRE-family HTH domain